MNSRKNAEKLMKWAKDWFRTLEGIKKAAITDGRFFDVCLVQFCQCLHQCFAAGVVLFNFRL